MSDKLADTMEALDLTNKQTTEGGEDDDFVDPWNVVGNSVKGIDYEKLISKIKCHIFKAKIFKSFVCQQENLDHLELILL